MNTSIKNLRERLRGRYGERLKPYASAPTETDGFGFSVDGIAAVFSAITKNGSLPPDRFDVQIESNPPGDYLYTAEVSLDELLDLIDVFTKPTSHWPQFKN